MGEDGARDFGRRRTLVKVGLVVSLPSAIAIMIAALVPDAELKKVLYAGAATLIFGGLLGGVLKLFLEDLTRANGKREDAGRFVTNVLSDLKAVYDRVGRAALLIPAHKSAKTYGNEMRGLIEALVQLRNVSRAMERRADGIDATTRTTVSAHVKAMETYLDRLTLEFRNHYKPVSDAQRTAEEAIKAILQKSAEQSLVGSSPPLPNPAWDMLDRNPTFPCLNDLMEMGGCYQNEFLSPLDAASEALREELASILSTRQPRQLPVTR